MTNGRVLRFGILFLIPIWNSCFLISQDDGSGNPVPSPTNVAAVADNGQAKISWLYGGFVGSYGNGFEVEYQMGGGAPDSCDGIIGAPQTGCMVGCFAPSPPGYPSSPITDSCTVTGLTNGVSYIFAVIAQGFSNRNPSLPVRSNPVTPMANISN